MAVIMAVAALVALRGLRRGVQEDAETVPAATAPSAAPARIRDRMRETP